MNAEGRLAAIGRHLLSEPRRIQLQQTCGIVAYIGDEKCSDVLLDGLTILQNRGYDSAGVATLDAENNLTISKFASRGSTSDSIDLLQKSKNNHARHKIGIAHTRWATHGGKTDANAHPHTDSTNRIALVHNGVIENCEKLRSELKGRGVTFRSETDTEVIAQLIGLHLQNGKSIEDAVAESVSRLEGTWGLVILDKMTPDRLIAAKNGSPLLIGQSDGQMFIGSEPLAFSRFTREYISLENGEIAVVKVSGHSLDQKRVQQSHVEKVNLTPEPYPHWTLKEITEQPSALSRVMNCGGRIVDASSVMLGGLSRSQDTLLSIRHLVISACGTSLHAAEFGAYLFRSLGCFDTVQTVNSAEFNLRYLTRSSSGLLVLSQSGETKDVHRVVVAAQEVGVPVFSCINAVGSLIARTTQCGIYINAGREVAVASTKAFTCQVASLTLIAIWFHQHRYTKQTQPRISLVESMHRLPTYTGMCIERTQKQCQELAQLLKDKSHMFILGKGLGYPIAREGALKIKEITYLHAEGYSGGALKHGPFALIEPGTPIILIILDDSQYRHMLTCAAEVSSRGAYTIAISNTEDDQMRKLCSHIISIPSNGHLTALQAIIPLQLLAYELAIARGIDPDKPRNLAKAVTVD